MVDRSAIPALFPERAVSFANRRQTQRVYFGGSVRIASRRGPVSAQIQDLSRSGIRVRVSAEALGFPPSPHLAPSAKNMNAALGVRFEVAFHVEVLGRLVHRRTTLTRLAIPSDCPEALDLGCRFETELTVDEISILGAHLPPKRSRKHDEPAHVEVVEELPPAEEPSSDVTIAPDNDGWVSLESSPVRAYVNGRDAAGTHALVCEAKSVSPDALQIWCRSDVNRAALGEHDIVRAAVRFSDTYGDDVELRVTRGSESVWGGSARVRGVEFDPEQPQAMLLTVGFERPLRPEDRTRFGLSA